MFWKLFVVVVALIGAVVSSLAAIASVQVSALLGDSSRERLHEIAITTRGAVADELQRAEYAELHNVLSNWLADAAELNLEVTILNAAGDVVAQLPSNSAELNQKHRPEIQQSLRRDNAGFDRRIDPRSGRYSLYSAVAVRRGTDLQGFVRIATPERPLRATQRGALFVIWSTAAGGWLLSSGLVWMWMARQFRPLHQLTAHAKDLAAGNDSSMMVDRNDEVGQLAAAITDIRTKRLLEATELREKSSLLISVLENMLEGVIAVAPDETVLLANGASGRLLGFSAVRAISRPLAEVARSRPLHDAVRTALSTGKPVRTEFEAGSELRRILALRAAPLDRAHGIAAVIVLHDVTELRRLENLRKEFVANVSHELKTPLSSIKAYAETLRLGALDDPDHRVGFVDRIEEQAERLHQLIIDLLHLARIESGQEAFEFGDIPLLQSIESCLEQYAAAAAAKNIRCTIENRDPPLVLHVDEEGLRTILNNLIDNAVKYTPEGGQVSVFWSIEGGYGVISVSDTGIGIAPRDQRRIFERFFRVDKARSRELGGTGLGLSIVKHLCQAFGGDVVVESQEGQGSTFRVRLPLASASATRVAADG